MKTTMVATSPASKYRVRDDKPTEELIEDAVAILERVGWVQNTLVTFRGHVCVIGALTAAIVETTDPEIIFNAAFGNPLIREKIEEIYGPFSWTTLTTYNDHPMSSKEDVIEMLRSPMRGARRVTAPRFATRSSEARAMLRLP